MPRTSSWPSSPAADQHGADRHLEDAAIRVARRIIGRVLLDGLALQCAGYPRKWLSAGAGVIAQFASAIEPALAGMTCRDYPRHFWTGRRAVGAWMPSWATIVGGCRVGTRGCVVSLSVRGRCLPDGVERTVFIDGDRITFDSVAGAELVHDGGWIVPALVDVHTHPGAHEPGDPMDGVILFDDLAAHVAAGVAVIRTPGIAGGVIPQWAAMHEDLPRIVGAGNWLASSDGFFHGWGRHLEPYELPGAAVEEATRSGGWCKVIVDWVTGEGAGRRYEPSVPADVVVDIVHAVHDVGGRVAVHSQHPDGAEAAVIAGADSLEHGMHLRHGLLERMAAQGTVLVPTMTAFEQGSAELSALDTPTWLSRYMTRGRELHPRLVRSAFEAGVTVLAGTDSTPHGNVAERSSAPRRRRRAQHGSNRSRLLDGAKLSRSDQPARGRACRSGHLRRRPDRRHRRYRPPAGDHHQRPRTTTSPRTNTDLHVPPMTIPGIAGDEPAVAAT